MTGEDWYVLSQCGEWIFDGLIENVEFKEYVTTMCCIFRLAASKKVSGELSETLRRLEARFQRLHGEIVPPMCHPLQFHRIRHLLENVSDIGPVVLYWCFRMERIIGRLVSSMNRKHDVEAVMETIVIKSRIGRIKLGTTVVAQDDLEKLQTLSVDDSEVASEIIDSDLSDLDSKTESSKTMVTREEYMSDIASDILERRERVGTRLNVTRFPEGSPLTKMPWRSLRQHELQEIRLISKL